MVLITNKHYEIEILRKDKKQKMLVKSKTRKAHS